MRIVVMLSLLVATRAYAQPDDCEVKIAHAPDDVREAIEQWLTGESCTVPLEVRVVPTEGGLYLLARDRHGRTRERIVPDAQAAGVLVASWAADDSMGPQRVPPETPESQQSPPSMLPARPQLDDIDRGAEAESRQRGNTWIELALLKSRDLGARVAVDLVQRGRWTFGAAGSLSKDWLFVDNWPTVLTSGGTGDVYELNTVDARAVAYGAGTFGGGPWTVRVSLGVGFAYTQTGYNVTPDNGWTVNHVSLDGVFPVAELCALVGRDLGENWGVDVGVLASRYAETFHLPVIAGYPTPESTMDLAVNRSSATWELVAGIKHRL
jgi:hypothetical protein